MSSHLESHRSLCSINHKSEFWNLSEKVPAGCHRDMSLFGPNSVFNINRGSGPLGYGVVHPVPSQHLKLYSVDILFFDVYTFTVNDSKIISGEACLLLHGEQGQFLWPDQHFVRTLCGPSSSGWGRGQLRPLPDNPEHRQEKEAEASWRWWPTARVGVEEYSEIFNKSHGENRAENVSILTGLSWEEHKICGIPRCPNTSISHPGQSIYFK